MGKILVTVMGFAHDFGQSQPHNENSKEHYEKDRVAEPGLNGRYSHAVSNFFIF